MAEERIESNDNFVFKEGQLPYANLAPIPGPPPLYNTDAPKMSFDDMINNISVKPTGAGISPILASELPSSSRYKFFYPGRDPEEMLAQQQGTLEKWASGLGKMAGTATTSFLNGTVGTVYGITQMINTQKFSSLYDNAVTRSLDNVNLAMEDYLPNFYTAAERDAAWYSGNNILTANFWSDKVLKNLGYSVGSIGAGVAWGGILGSIGLTNRLVAAGRGMEAATAVENAIATAAPIQRFGAVRNALTGLSNQYLKSGAANILTNADRGLISVMGTMGEASFESLQNLNNTRDKMIQSYIAKNGMAPTGEDLEEINLYAEKVGNFTWGMNVALLSATNYIQLPKILNSSKTAEKRIMNNVVKESLETGASISERVGAKYVAEKAFLEKIGGNTGRIFNKYVAKPVGLFFAPVESFEEGAQYAIQTGTQDYFLRAYDTNKNVTDFWSNLTNTFGNVLGEGVRKTLSEKEGIEGLLIGGISGGIQTSFSPFGQSTIKERGLFGDGGIRAKNTQIAIDALNNSKNLNDVLKDAVKFANIGINSQQLRQEAVGNGDTLNEKDYENDYALSYIMPRVKYGKADSIKEELELYRQQAFTEQGFQELKNAGVVLENEDRTKFVQRLENIMTSTNQVQEMYDILNDKYSSLTDDKGNRVYSDAAIDKMVYASAKVADYDGRLAGLQGKLAGQGILTGKIDEALKNAEGWEENNFEKILNNEDVVTAISEIAEPLSKSKGINTDLALSDVADYIDLILRRNLFIDEFNQIKNSPAQFAEVVPADFAKTTELKDEEGKEKPTNPTIKLTTKDGEEDIEVGVEYFLGKVVKKSATGKDVFFAPKFTILGENEDGTIQIQDNKGVRSVSKEEFAEYKLGKVSDTLNNKKAKFFLENWNTIFEHFGLKDKSGKPKRGRLRYSPKEGVLEFVFLNGRGEERSVEVTGDMFKPKKGFVHGLLKEVGELTTEQAQAKEDFKNETPTEEELVERPNRLKILGEMYSELTERRQKTDSLIEQKKKEVVKIKDEITTLEKQVQDAKVDQRVKKTVKFKSVTKKALSNAMRLSRMQEQLEREIESLEADREDIDLSLVYVSDLLDNVRELPKTEKKFLQELENHVLDLELMQEKTGKQINLVSKLLDQTTTALESAIEFINNLITKFENKYPNVPRVMGQEYVDFLKANPNFLKLKPNYREDLAQIEDQIAFIDEGEVLPSESRLNELKDHFALLEESLNDIQKEWKAYREILDRFEDAHRKYKAQQSKQKALAQNKTLAKQLVGTLDNSVQNISEPTKKYEPVSKKSDLDVVGGTTAGSEKDENKPFNQRAQRFGFKFNNLPNRDSLRGIVVTANTENQILPGLTDHLVKGSNADPKTVIAMVMVAENPDGTYYLVDENGQALPEGADLLNTAIYQVFPLDELKANYDGQYQSMFRESTPKEVQDSLREQYKAWRTSQLEQTVLGMPEKIDSSFGIPQYVEIPTDKSDENGNTIMERDYSARTSAEAAGLITPSMMKGTKLITVATTNESVSNGSVTFSTPLGRVFLQVPGGLVKLFNRKFNEKEANTIFDVLQQLSANAIEDGSVKTDRSTRLINWLKSTVYFGIAKDPDTKKRKDAGYNNIWFEEVLEDNKPVTKLYISGVGTGFNFDPESLDENRELIVNMLQEMYNNTNATMANDNSYSNSYIEIIGIDESGEPITKTWENYQTYLLSSEGRTPNEIPLTTQFRPLSGPNDINRKGIYFKFKNTVDRFNTTPATPKIVEKPQPAKPAETKPVEQKPKEKVLDGETWNETKIGSFGTVRFKLNGKLFNETNGEQGFVVEFNSDVLNAIMSAINVDEQNAKGQIYGAILQMVQPQLNAMALPKVAPVEEFTPEENDDWDNEAVEAPDDKVYRLELAKKSKKFENFEKVEAWLKQNFPNIPVYRVKNVIQATNGKQAWGMFQNGAIYIYENAGSGTAYHEVFEAVWKMFTSPEERQAIINEFRSRPGSYTDRFTGETVKYSEATDAQLKEELAEEFTDFKLYGKEADIPKESSLIKQLFRDIINFIKEFFTGKSAASNTQELFNRIDSGYYARYNPYETRLSVGKAGIISIDDIYAGEGAEYRITPIDVDSLINKIPATQLHDIMQHMTYKTLATLVENKKSLFKLPSKSELYEMLKDDVLKTIRWQGAQYETSAKNNEISTEQAAKRVGDLKDLYKNVKSEWDTIVQKHEQQLMSYSITFSEDDNAIIGDENKSGKGDYQDSRKIDTFKKANSAIKLMVAAVPNVTVTANDVTFKRTDEGLVSLVPADVVFASLMSQLETSTSIDDMLARLRTMAIDNPNYAPIYERLTGQPVKTPGISLQGLKKHDLNLISAFWKTFKKQNPDVLSVFVLPSGEVVIGDGSLAGAARQTKRELSNSILGAVKAANVYFKYNAKDKIYSATSKLQSVKLDRSQLGSYVAFLKDLNIEFKESDLRKLTDNQLKTFLGATEGILKSLSKIDELATISSKTLNIDGQLLKIATIKSIIENPQFDLTYFNADGERVQSSIGVNAMSNLYDVLSKAKNISDLIGTPYEYLLTDVYSQGSELLNKMFNVDGDGKRKDNSEEILKPSYTDATINENTGRVKDQSKYQYKDRIIQEINMNLQGVYSNLVPGDASIGWSQRMYNPESPFVTENEILNNDYFRIFRNHFISEVNLARDGRNVLRDGDKLRFFRSILGKELADEITSRKNINTSAEDLFDGSEYNSKIKSAIAKAVTDNANGVERLLSQYGIIVPTPEGLTTPGLALSQDEIITEEEIKRKLKLHAANYMIANMELHKVLYSDPYQYNDELKRIKSFSSPRQALVGLSAKYNAALYEAYNEGYEEGDIAHTDFSKDFFRAATIDDVFSTDDVSEDYIDPFEETDGGGYIISKGNRVYGIRAGDWTEENELQHAYDMAYEKIVKGEGLSDEEKAKRGLVLNDQEKKFEIKKITAPDGSVIYRGKNPNVKSTYTPRKPIVSGSKLSGRGYNDVVLDKFALVPLSFRVLHELNPNSNAIKLYNKMQKEDVDYVVYGTGRKVGAEKSTPLYNEDGSFNETPFQSEEEQNNPSLPQGVLNIPFNIMGVQAEVPSKDEPQVTQGTQITEMVTMDFLEAGVPIDFKPEIKDPNERFKQWNATEDKEAASPLFKEIQNNQKLLRARVLNGFENLKTKLGITEVQKKVEENGKLVTKKSFEIADPDKLVEELYSEVIKSGVNDNVLYALNGLKFGKVVLEATPAYQYIRNLLFSIADKEIVSPKVNGGSKVQIPSTLLESVRAEGKEFTDKDGNKKMSYTSKDLKFYTDKDGERVCEIMVARWFKSDMSDEELLNYFNNTEEGQKILKGVAFRIPTQKQNSIDTFKIVKFLPESFGDSVVIPSALVKKVGSDFDIDKLSIYLKNVYQDENGRIKLVTLSGTKEESRKQFEDIYRENILKKFDKVQNTEQFKNDLLDVLSKIEKVEGTELIFDTKEEESFYNDNKKILQQIINQAYEDGIAPSEYIRQQLVKIEGKKEELVSKLFNTVLKNKFVDSMYTKALENEYFESLQNLISHPLNFERLVKPNSADQLKALSKEIVQATGQTSLDSKDTGNMLSFEFMTKLRQAFVSGKYAIGIAAVGQKNHSQNQRGFVYIDADRLEGKDISEDDKKFLGDGKIYFEKYNKLDGKPTLSFIKDADGENYISDVIGQFIDGYVDISKGPWIMEMGATPNVTSTWLFLIKLGVPINTVAYFMNQPIIRNYLRTLESEGYSWLFIDKFVEDMLDVYSPQAQGVSVSEIPNESQLKDMLGKKTSDMTDVEKAQQQFILTEFLKYSKMASHLYDVTSGSNFDTATINDSFLVFKKMLQYEKAKKTIISSVDDILDNSFVGTIKDVLLDVRDAFAQILISDKTSTEPGRFSVRDVMENVLRPYTVLSDRDFVKVANKAVNDLFDWAVQTDKRVNNFVSNILLGSETEESAAKQIMEFKKTVDADPEHPLHNNFILNSIRLEEGERGKPDNLYLVNKTGKANDQNLLIYGFRQLKDGMGEVNKDLYGKLVRLAVIQSGLSNSPISFTTLLPYEDFETIYNDTLSNLGNLANLEKYYTVGAFQRNNASNNNIVPFVKARLLQSKKNKSKWFYPNTAFLNKDLETAMNKGEISKVINVSAFSKDGQTDYITFQWELPISKAEREKRRKTGNRSHIKKGLFKKVYTTDAEGNKVPLIQTSFYDGKEYLNFVYKHINAWGDSFRANEFYDYERPSQLDNGFEKVYKVNTDNKPESAEVDDKVIENILYKTKTQPGAAPIKNQPEGKPAINLTPKQC